MKIYRPLLHTPSLTEYRGEKTLALAVEIYDLESVGPRSGEWFINRRDGHDCAGETDSH